MIFETFPANAIVIPPRRDLITHFLLPEAHNNDNGYAFSARLYQVVGCVAKGQEQCITDAEECGAIFLKWDGCAHIGLRDPELDSNWVHVCGPEDMEDTLHALRHSWLEVQKRIAQYDDRYLLPERPQ